MSGTMTLSQLQLAVLQRADMVNSTFIDQTIGGELTSYVNQSYLELYDLLVSRYGDNWFVQVPYQFTTDGSTFQYPLPADFYKLLGLDLALANQQNSFVTLKPFNFAERNRWSTPNIQSFYGVTNMFYRINGNNLWLNPLPAAGQLMQMWYVPVWTPLVLGTDVVTNVQGWLEYIIIDAAIKCLQKEESDVTVLGLQKSAIISRIEAMAMNRDAGMPATVQDTQGNDYWNHNGGDGYGGVY